MKTAPTCKDCPHEGLYCPEDCRPLRCDPATLTVFEKQEIGPDWENEAYIVIGRKE